MEEYQIFIYMNENEAYIIYYRIELEIEIE